MTVKDFIHYSIIDHSHKLDGLGHLFGKYKSEGTGPRDDDRIGTVAEMIEAQCERRRGKSKVKAKHKTQSE